MSSKPQLSPQSTWMINSTEVSSSESKLKANELVMAWARDMNSKEPVYILELREDQRGSRCHCECVSCELPLVAVNAAKVDYQQRPHFRHPKGAERNSCLILAARFALAQQLFQQDVIELPRRRRSSRIAGLSGDFHEAWVELPAERVRITHTQFQDKAKALLTLDDGRQLVVELTGTLSEQQDASETLIPTITLNITDPSIAAMSPEELRSRLTLLWAGACWRGHWKDMELQDKARDKARQLALDSLDWLDDNELEDAHSLTIEQKKETLLHREVKAILEREKRINLPELIVNVVREAPKREGYKRETRWGSQFVTLDNVHLEKRLGRVIPDVIATVKDDDFSGYQLHIEVTVTNPINAERLERIKLVNFPTLEIDVGRMGGVVTKAELVELVVNELSAKRWIHHPKAIAEVDKLNLEIDTEIQRLLDRDRRRAESIQIPIEVWLKRFLEAITKYSNLRESSLQPDSNSDITALALEEVQDVAYALSMYGYPEARDVEQYSPILGTIIERILSIKTDRGVGYRLDTGWQVINAILQDRDRALVWHTLYLIAIKQYKPKLNQRQSERVELWRTQVVDSIKDGSSAYLRSQKYDNLLGLLFPEMKDALRNGFGRVVSKVQARSVSKPTPKYESPPQSSVGTRSESFWLKGKALDEWKSRYPESAKKWFDEG